MALTKTSRKKFGVVLADPPWNWSPYANSGKGRSAEAYYDLMDIEDIKKIPVLEWVKDDAVLFLWIHNSMIPEGLGVMKAWGFTYKSRGFTWLKIYPKSRKPCFGLGKWTRLSTELCLLGTKGNPKVMSKNVREFLVAPRRRHSEKPDEIYELIERLAEGPYLELFASVQTARSADPNWTSWIGKDRSTIRRWDSDDYP